MIMKRKQVIVIVCIVVVFFVAWIAFCGYQWSWGPFASLHNIKTKKLPGNAEQYDTDTVSSHTDSFLEGKIVIFLGSSVTYGTSSQGVSFADFLAVRHGFTAVKEAVSGTTLVDNGASSYVRRLQKIETSSADLFICQLSTNDASKKKPLGEINSSKIRKGFDTSTVAGAMEFIICYAQDKWGCPVMFYTNAKYDSETYANMVDLLSALQEKWGIGVIDLWHDEEFNDISSEQRKLYMTDAIHPTKAGYLEWWMPEMERYIENYWMEGAQ